MSKWKYCSDDLPEIGDRVLVKTYAGKIHYAIYTAADEWDVHIPQGHDFEEDRKAWFKHAWENRARLGLPSVVKWKFIAREY